MNQGGNMPVKRSTKDNKPCYKYGDEGKCYTFSAGDKESRERAKELAARQGRAIEASKSDST